MSKDRTPQVGDVWIHKKGDYPIHITDVGSNFIEFVGYIVDEYTKTKHRQYYTNSFSSLNNDERYTRFTEIYKYLGKSKASIEQLFEVENEE